MNATIKNFVRPEGQVFFGDIVIDNSYCKFSLNYAILAKRKRKLYFQKIEGVITPELREWLTIIFDKKIKVTQEDGTVVYKNTGEQTTGFQLYLERRGIAFTPGILSTMTFSGETNSEDYYANPFKLIILNDKAVLSLVNVAPKKKSQTHNPATGKVETHYSQRYFQVEGGGYRKSYVPKKNYCRLVIQQDITVPVEEPVAS